VPGLADFREQYPQYADLTDEALASRIYKQHYSDMDPIAYRRKLGLAVDPQVGPPREDPRARIDNLLKSANTRNRARAGELLGTLDEFADRNEPQPTSSRRPDPNLEPLIEHGRRNLETGAGFTDDRGIHTILSGSVEDERLNGGRPTVIPFVYDGRELDAGDAIERAIASGIEWPSADTNEQATEISKAASSSMDAYLKPTAPPLAVPTVADDYGQPPGRHGFFSNAARLAAERGSSLLGAAIKGIVGLPGEALERKLPLGQIVFGSDWGEGDPDDGKFRVRYLNADEVKQREESQAFENLFTEIMPEYLRRRDFGGERRNTPDEIKKAYDKGDVSETLGSVLKFGIETGIESVPDMIAVLTPFTFPAYIAARAEELGERRAEAKGLERVSLQEQLEALPFAIGSALLERVGAKGIAEAGVLSKAREEIGALILREGLKRAAIRTVTETGKAAGREALTEAVQEGMLEYVAERWGTETAMSFGEAAEQGFFAALAGGTFGGVAAGTMASSREAGRLSRRPVNIEEYFNADPVPRETPPPTGPAGPTIPPDVDRGAPDPGAGPEPTAAPAPAPPPTAPAGDSSTPGSAGTAPDSGLPAPASPPFVDQRLVPLIEAVTALEAKTGDRAMFGHVTRMLEAGNVIGALDQLERLASDLGTVTEPDEAMATLRDQIRELVADMDSRESGLAPDQDASPTGAEASRPTPEPTPAPASAPSAPSAPEPIPEPRPLSEDPRLVRETHRVALAALADELVVGGQAGIPIYDDNDRIISRTPSVNPEWFQSLNTEPSTSMSVKRVRNAVEKALDGRKLGVREARVVAAMLDVVTESRTHPENLAYVRQELEAARTLRREAREAMGPGPAPVAAYEDAGEFFEETEYLPEMTGEDRALYELVVFADQAGYSEQVSGILAGNLTAVEAATLIEALLNGQEIRFDPETAEVQPFARPAADSPDQADEPGEAATQAQEVATSFDRIEPGDSLGPYVAGTDVANTSSIAASLTAGYEVEPGIQRVPLSNFYAGKSPNLLTGVADDLARSRALADEIRGSGRMDPLIVVLDAEGAYVLEGGHRLDAAYLLGAEAIPAIVVREQGVPPLARAGPRAEPQRLAAPLGRVPILTQPENPAHLGGTIERARQAERARMAERDGDLFGDDTAAAQAMADEERRRDAARNAGQDSIETGDPGDLFSEARRQTDLEDAIDAEYSDPETGLENMAAFEAAGESKALAAVEIDELAELTKTLGDEAGEAVLKAAGRALRRRGLDAYHAGSGQIWVRADSMAELTEELELVAADLEEQVVETSKGKLEGIGITVGADPNSTATGAEQRNDALLELKARRSEKRAFGHRARPGESPPGTVLYSSRPLDMEAGTNYVPITGRLGNLPLTPDHQYQLGNGRTVRIPKNPVRRRHILKALERGLGAKIYEGRVKGPRSRLGFFRPGHGEVRSRHRNDLEVIAHEISHWLDGRYPWIQALYQQPGFLTEVLTVSYDVTKDYEGFAEFGRLWFTQEHLAREHAPGFYDAFMEELDQHPKLRDTLYAVQELMHAWHLQGDRARLASKIGKDKLSISQRFNEIFYQWSDRLLQKTFDELRPFKQAERQIRGEVADATDSPYKAFRLARGAHGIVRAVFYRGTIGWTAEGDIEFTGEGLKDVFASVEDRMDAMQLYMVARRAQELQDQGRENLMRPDEIAAGLRLGDEDAELGRVFDKWLAFSKRMLDFYEQSGIISPDSRRAIEEINKNYVPFNRVIDEITGDQRVMRPKRGSPFMRLKGGTSNVNDVFDNIVSNMSRLVQMSLINDGKRKFYRMLEGADNQTAALYAAPIGTDTTRVTIDKAQVLKAFVEGLGFDMTWYRMAKTGLVGSEEEIAIVEMIDMLASNLDGYVAFWKRGQDPKGNIDFYFEAGKKRFFEIADPGLYEAINHLGPNIHNFWVNVLGGFSNVLRRGVTATPNFQIKNFIRDTLNAFTLSRGQIVPIAAPTKALLERIYNDEHYWLYMANGGGYSSMAQASGINVDHVIDSPDKMLDRYDEFMSAFEYANRIAEFKALRARGVSSREAALAGREISTDFAMHGSSDALRVITLSVWPLNARMQGLYRVAREAGEMRSGRFKFLGARAFSYALRAGLAITLPSLILYMMNKDDERYQELPEWIKDLSWIFFTGEGEDDYLIIPKPFETGALFGTLPERMVEYMYSHDQTELADAMLWMAMETFSLNPIPQAYAPLDDLRRNQKFTGAPIIPQWLEAVEPAEQYQAYTSDAMIALGRKLGISPLKAEHLVRGYFGTLGAWALGAADYVVGDLSEGGIPPARTWRDNILLRSFVDDGPLRRTKSQDDLYAMLRETREVVATINLISDRSPDRIEAYVSDSTRQVLQANNSALEQAASQVREIENAIDRIEADRELTAEAKRDAINELHRARNQITREVRLAINPAEIRRQIEELEAELAAGDLGAQ